MVVAQWAAPYLIGLVVGVSLFLATGLWLFPPAGGRTWRGYFNAFATGFLLAAAIKLIPEALMAVEFYGYSALASHVLDGVAPERDSFLGVLIAPGQIQVIVQAVGAATVMLLFFRGNASSQREKGDATGDQPGRPWAKVRSWLALPPSGLDWAGLTIITIGLFSYNLWIGASRAPLFGPAANGSFWLVLLLVFYGTLLGIAVLGCIDSRKDLRLAVFPTLLLGLAIGVGLNWPGGHLTVVGGLLPLLAGSACLVYGIGRLLRVLQHDIGLGWRTTLVVAVGTGIVYQSRLLF